MLTETIDVTGLSLLSKREYELYKDAIPLFEGADSETWWWLKTKAIVPGAPIFTFLVMGAEDGNMADAGFVDARDIAVRPALHLVPGQKMIKRGLVFRFMKYCWTVISPDLAICNDWLCKMPFRADCKAPFANQYEESDIRAYLDMWWQRYVEKLPHDKGKDITSITVEVSETITIRDIAGITLLTPQQYREAESYIPALTDTCARWWLKPLREEESSIFSPCVSEGKVWDPGFDVRFGGVSVRPAIIFKMDAPYVPGKSAYVGWYKVGESYFFGGKFWRVLPCGLALCESVLTETPYREEWDEQENQPNNYERSTVKTVINNWLEGSALIKEITLPDYPELKGKNIPQVKGAWWLRAKGDIPGTVSYVNAAGLTCFDGHSDQPAGVRPMLVFYPEYVDFKTGETLSFGGYTWTVIEKGKALCDQVIKNMAFSGEKGDGSNLYYKSDIKLFLENWLQEQVGRPIHKINA